MKKNTLSLASIVTVASLGATAALAGAQLPAAATPLAGTAAAEFGRWIYEVAPARPELLLPLVFAVTVMTVAAMVVHHLRQDQELEVMENHFAPNRRSFQRKASRMVTHAVLLPRRAA